MTTRLCTICARGGSKGVKNKNLRLLAGRPLLAHSIEQAKRSGMFAVVAVSSDSDEILATAGQWGADELVKRPDDLASDTAPKVPAIRHCAREVEARRNLCFDTIVDLDATSPLRDQSDIVGAIELLESSGCANVVTGAPSRRSPYFNLVELDGTGRVRLSKPPAAPIVRRQDSPSCYDLNASVFCWSRRQLFDGGDLVLGEDVRLFVMPEERSVDIDTEQDFVFVEYMMTRKVPNDQ